MSTNGFGYEEIKFHIRGLVPLLLHNGQLSDPLNKFSQAVAKAYKVKQKQKTEASEVELSRCEFFGGLYIGDDGGPCIPGEVLESAIRTAAKMSKEGKNVQMGLFCNGNFPIIYSGPRKVEELWDSLGDGLRNGTAMDGRRFVDRRRVKIGKAAVMRTRPIFNQWELKFTVSVDPMVLNRKSVIEFVETLGKRVGLCECRPRYGRFEVVEAE